MEAENTLQNVAAAHEQVTASSSSRSSLVVKHSNVKTSCQLERQSVKVSDTTSQSIASWNAISDNQAAVEEVKPETTECTKTAKSCNEQKYFQQNVQEASYDEVKSEYHENFVPSKEAAIDNMNIQELAREEHFDSIDVSHVSDFWDQVQVGHKAGLKYTFVFQETYLSEHNYDEVMDVETAKNILNFGDDYRNFIESNSEVQSPRFLESVKKKRSSRSKVNRFYFQTMS